MIRRFFRLLRAWTVRIFSVDYRSLALLRMGVGAVILVDLIDRSRDLVVHYTDAGLLPRAELMRLWTPDWLNSIYLTSGHWQFVLALFIVSAVAAIMLIVGYRTKLAVIVSWILLMSLQARNPLILQGGDIVLRVTIFWMVFLPIGRAFSVDRLLNRIPRPTKKTFFSAATAAYLMQIAAVYFFSAVLKTGSEWHADGSAVYYALNIDQFVRGLGVFIREYPGIMTFFTHFVYYVELIAPLLLFIPFKRNFFRTIMVLAIIGLHLGFNTSMRLGLFGLIGATTALGLLPSGFWDGPFKKFRSYIARKGKQGLVIYYDFDCSFCAKMSVALARALLLFPETRVLPSTDTPEIEALMREKDSWVIEDASGTRYFGWSGVATVVAHSPYLFWSAPLLRLKPIAFLGERLYRHIARRRLSVCIPEPLEKEVSYSRSKKIWRTAGSLAILLLFLYGLSWDLYGLKAKHIPPRQLNFIAWTTRLDQQFNMFAPRPLTEDGWYIMPGELRDGTIVDVFTGKPVTYDKPKRIAYMYKNQRWQKYMMNLWLASYADYRLGYGRYLCREWNKDASEEKKLITFSMIFMLEQTPKPGEPQSPVEQKNIWDHRCFAN